MQFALTLEKCLLEEGEESPSVVVVPEGTVTLSAGVFRRFRQMQSVVLPSTLRSIGDNAFSECVRLKDVVLPDSVEHLGAGAFHCCTSLRTIAIPPALMRIEDRAFYGCTSLRSVTGCLGLEEVGAMAFASCASLESFDFEWVWKVGSGAFSQCASLASPVLLDHCGFVEAHAFENCACVPQFRVPADVYALGKDAFKGCAGAALASMDALAARFPEAFPAR